MHAIQAASRLLTSALHLHAARHGAARDLNRMRTTPCTRLQQQCVSALARITTTIMRYSVRTQHQPGACSAGASGGGGHGGGCPDAHAECARLLRIARLSLSSTVHWAEHLLRPIWSCCKSACAGYYLQMARLCSHDAFPARFHTQDCLLLTCIPGPAGFPRQAL